MDSGKIFSKMLVLAVTLAVLSNFANSISIGISPGRVNFDGVLREGYAERTVLVSTASEDEIIMTLRPDPDVLEWIRFEPNASTFTVSKKKPYPLKIIAEPPPDFRIGNYSGRIEVITEGFGGAAGRAGAMVKTSVLLMMKLEITGKESVKCRAGGVTLNDVESGFPLELETSVINDGNVRLAPTISVDVWDQKQENLLLSREVVGDIVLPTTKKKIIRAIPHSLKEGQYWANVNIRECGTSSLLTFSVLEKGGIADKGELLEITNKPWALTNETVQITAKFQNTGQRSVNARFKGAIRLDDKIVRLIETDEVIVPAGEVTNFDIFFVPEISGRYTLTGRVVYNKKLTFEKGTIINVNPAGEGPKKFGLLENMKKNMLPLLVYLIIIITILFIMRKIAKERKKRSFR